MTIVQPHIRHHRVEGVALALGQLAFTRSVVAPGSTDLVIWPEYSLIDYLDGEHADGLAVINRDDVAYVDCVCSDELSGHFSPLETLM